jgi:hypothetical protein
MWNCPRYLRHDTSSANNDNDRDNDSNINLVLDYNIAVNSAISSAVFLRDKDIAPALRQIHSRWVRYWRVEILD